ncbi:MULTISPECIES: sensor domain-containing diguanylate cyclase [unclassified Exiguobacterium]|uniref:GGDEF domain-containing protein n=1 Tax=unclassified Exiguobacterium TaxID=2644629 RepID=UPI001BE9D7C6|nr:MULTISPECIES: sensor domain-containing diguanylate cyclase [unclassified Exiguobacterium]
MTLFFWGILVGFLIALWLYKRQQPYSQTLSFMHFGNQTKDVIYIFETKPAWRFRYISPSLDLYLGEGTVMQSYSDARECFRRIHPDDRRLLLDKVAGRVNYEEAILQRWRTNDGSYVWFEEYTTPIYENGEIVAVQGVIRNIEAAMTERERLLYESRHDSLTGVFNRRAFEETIDQDGKACDVGIIVLDVNDLKIVNDEEGHSAGDRLLKRVGMILQEIESSVYRLGGDEFVLFLEMMPEDACERMVCQIEAACQKESISVAIGLAWASHPASIEGLWQRADDAMYEQKRQQKTDLLDV